jgi:hypothetical protein
VAVQHDGVVWASWRDSGVGRLDAYGWSTWLLDELPEVDLGDREGYTVMASVAVSTDGSVFVGRNLWAEQGPGLLLRLVGDTWEEVDPVGGGLSLAVNELVAGPDGTVWAYLGSPSTRGYLARFDSESWVTFGDADGVPTLGAPGNVRGRMAVAPDGGLWLNPQVDGVDTEGIMAFDGSSWTTYGRGLFGEDMDLDIGPSGTPWVAHGAIEDGPGSLYVVRPSDGGDG